MFLGSNGDRTVFQVRLEDLCRTSFAFVQADMDALAVVDPHQPRYRHRQALCHPLGGRDPPAGWDGAQDHRRAAEGRERPDDRDSGGR